MFDYPDDSTNTTATQAPLGDPIDANWETELKQLTPNTPAQTVFEHLQKTLGILRGYLTENNCAEEAEAITEVIGKNQKAWDEMLADPDPRAKDEGFRKYFCHHLCQLSGEVSNIVKMVAHVRVGLFKKAD